MSLEPPPYLRPNLAIAERVSDLLGRMTLGEKLDQLHQCGVGDTNPNNLAQRLDQFQPTYGSYIVGGPWRTLLETRNVLQQRAVEESRLGIPALFGADVIHGYRTIAPIPLAQACSWNPELVRRLCAMAGAEARAHGIDWTFAPMVDHCVDARWGRIAETFGESPHASSVFAVASIQGYQENPAAPIAACLKHYVGYGASEGGRDYVSTDISWQKLWEMHLPPFEAGVRAGAYTVMSAFNDLSGIPTSAHPYTLTEILRQRWHFAGPVVSDWASVAQLIHQGFAAHGAEAAQKALNAGVDIDMADGLFREHIKQLIERGLVSLQRVDEATGRVLWLKFKLGLFERPYTKANALTAPSTPPPENLRLTEEAAARSLVLLKNNGALPLAANVKRIALLGPVADRGGPLLGSWAQQGDPAETETLAAALRSRLGSDVTLIVAPGCGIDDYDPSGIEQAQEATHAADLIIVCLGEDQHMNGENASRSTLRPAGRQTQVLDVALATNKPVILVLVAGRPLEIDAVEHQLAAVVAAWCGGSRGAAAIADALLGRLNPSGRLAVTWPRTAGQIPLYHNMRPKARLADEGNYRDSLTTPLYEFGHGLSYTTFQMGPIQLSATTLSPRERLIAEVAVTNTGPRDGIETVLWFIRDVAAGITRPLKELKHFEQALIGAGQTLAFRFVIEPKRDLTFPDDSGRPQLEPGEFILFAGGERVSFHLTA